MLGIIIAEREETDKLLQNLNTKIIEYNKIRFFFANFDNVLVVICFSGVGKANAAAAAMSMIDNFNPRVIFNIGACGSSRPNIKINDIIVVNKVGYADVDLEAFGYKKNLLPNEKMFYEANKKYVDKVMNILKDNKPVCGCVATSDSIITQTNYEHFPALTDATFLGFDMELMAIAQICYKTQTDFFAIKCVSDNLTLQKKLHLQYDESLTNLPNKIDQIVIKVIKNIFI